MESQKKKNWNLIIYNMHMHNFSSRTWLLYCEMKPSLFLGKIFKWGIMWKRMPSTWCLISLSQENITWLLYGISTWTSSSRSPGKHRYCSITSSVNYTSIRIDLLVEWCLSSLCMMAKVSSNSFSIHYLQNSRYFH